MSLLIQYLCFYVVLCWWLGYPFRGGRCKCDVSTMQPSLKILTERSFAKTLREWRNAGHALGEATVIQLGSCMTIYSGKLTWKYIRKIQEKYHVYLAGGFTHFFNSPIFGVVG